MRYNYKTAFAQPIQIPTAKASNVNILCYASLAGASKLYRNMQRTSVRLKSNFLVNTGRCKNQFPLNIKFKNKIIFTESGPLVCSVIKTTFNEGPKTQIRNQTAWTTLSLASCMVELLRSRNLYHCLFVHKLFAYLDEVTLPSSHNISDVDFERSRAITCYTWPQNDWYLCSRKFRLQDRDLL